jgi:hypothetical protein
VRAQAGGQPRRRNAIEAGLISQFQQRGTTTAQDSGADDMPKALKV